MTFYLVKSKFVTRNLYGHRSTREVTNLVEASSKENVEQIVTNHIVEKYQKHSTQPVKMHSIEVFETLSEINL